MKSIHNYIQFHCNDSIKVKFSNWKYFRIYEPRSRVSYNSLYRKLDVKTRVGKWKPVFKGNVQDILCDSRYWFGNC